MPTTENKELFMLRAIDFAARKHRDQRRKDEEASPYINHPISVSLLLAEIGDIADADVLSAAILHDTLEYYLRTSRGHSRIVQQLRQLK
jgi:guanosine-3',5'-bis(diphosphate) 3'-pyrophosphohydrolase